MRNFPRLLLGLIYFLTIYKAEVVSLEATVVKGWPYYISCTEILLNQDYDYESAYSCTIKDATTGNVLFNQTLESYSEEIGYFIPDITNNTSTQYQIIQKNLVDGTVTTTNLTLVVSDFEQVSCNTEELCEDDSPLPASVGAVREFSCEERECDRSEGRFNPTIEIEQGLYAVSWYRDCTKLEVNGSKLVLNDITLGFHPGNYTCSVTYKGMERFVIKYRLCVQEGSSGSSEASEARCSRPDAAMNETIDALSGWPLLLSCENLLHDSDLRYMESDNATCIITDLDTTSLIFKKNFPISDTNGLRHNIGDVNETSSRRYSINVKIDGKQGSSVVHYVTLNIIPFVQSTCETEPDMQIGFNEVTVTEGRGLDLHCADLNDYSAEEEIKSGLFDAEWYRDCNLIPGETAGILSLPSVSFETPGNYTCAIKYKGMTRFVIRRQICVQLKSSRQVSVQCPDAKKVKLGEKFEIECIADTGQGEPRRFDYGMNFNKLSINGTITPEFDNISCTDDIDDDDNRTVVRYNQDVSCLFKFKSLTELRCFKTPPTEEVLTIERSKTNKFLISYSIESVTQLYFGEYVARVFQPSGTISSNDTFVIALQDDSDITEYSLRIGLGITIGVIIFVIICVIFKLEITWFFKRYCGSYHPEPSQFCAYIGYYYDRENGHLQEITTIYKEVMEFLNKIGGPLYDKEQIPSDVEGRFDNIRHAQRQCDRVIILLTPDYIKTNNDDFEIFTEEENKNRTIFITTNQTRDAIANLDERMRARYKGMLKINDTLKWPGSRARLKYRFFMRLELLMPKRRREVNVSLHFRNGHAGIVGEDNDGQENYV